MKIKVADNQTLLDVSMQHLGSAEYAMRIALENDISISDDLVPGTELELPAVELSGAQQKVVKFFRSNPLKIPATAEPNI